MPRLAPPLPGKPSLLIGRELEMKVGHGLLVGGVRLLTLTGPPGPARRGLALSGP